MWFGGGLCGMGWFRACGARVGEDGGGSVERVALGWKRTVVAGANMRPKLFCEMIKKRYNELCSRVLCFCYLNMQIYK